MPSPATVFSAVVAGISAPGSSRRVSASINSVSPPAGGLARKRRVMVRNKRAYADHLRAQPAQIAQVGRKRLRRLAGRADHEPGPHLIAELPELTQAPHTVFQCRRRGMQAGIVRGVRRLMPQQIAVRPGPPPCGVALFRMLAQRQGHRAVRVARPLIWRTSDSTRSQVNHASSPPCNTNVRSPRA